MVGLMKKAVAIVLLAIGVIVIFVSAVLNAGYNAKWVMGISIDIPEINFALFKVFFVVLSIYLLKSLKRYIICKKNEKGAKVEKYFHPVF